jgi:hypothetical protein
MTSPEAARLLLISGGTAILFSSLLGLVMVVLMQPWGRRLMEGFDHKAIGAAHLDWIMLGLMQGLAAGMIFACALTPSPWAIIALVAGAWLNPLPYVLRAFGINAFVFGGNIAQRTAAALGLTSSLAIIVGWAALLITTIA